MIYKRSGSGGKPYSPTADLLRKLNLNDNEIFIVKDIYGDEIIPGEYMKRGDRYFHYIDDIWYPVAFHDPIL